uniref:hypothetical protein n=1 Tax=Halorussus salinisoli TaxID=2558242 RepID=UPI0010C194DD|nr:hypothetical protein [Halorussus salinisoli]
MCIALRDDHLPHLVDAGVVEYDDDTVVPTSKLDAVCDWLNDSARVAPDTTASLREQLTAFYA